MTLKLDRNKVCRLMIACTEIQYSFERDANAADDDDVREIYASSARMWKDLHDEIKAQIEKGVK